MYNLNKGVAQNSSTRAMITDYMRKIKQLQSQNFDSNLKDLMQRTNYKAKNKESSLNHILQKQLSEKTLPQQKSLNNLKSNQNLNSTDRSNSNRKLSPYVPGKGEQRKLSQYAPKRLSTHNEENSTSTSRTNLFKDNTPKFTSKNSAQLFKNAFGSGDYQMDKKSEMERSSEDHQTHLNNQFIYESRNNNTGACLQLLEPTLAHNYLKLPSSSKINPNLKACITAKDSQGNTALHYAAKNGNTQLLSALIFKQMDLDIQNRDLMTPLIMGSIYGKDDVVLALLNAGGDANMQDSHGNTALHYAAKNSHKVIVSYLLKKYSIDTTKKNGKNETADRLASSKEIQQLFHDYQEEKKMKSTKVNKIQIQQTQNEMIQKLFHLQERKRIESHHSQQNKTTVNSGSTNSDSYEDKVGPQHFQMIGMIGKGSFGEVYLVSKRSQPSSVYAMKVLEKSRILSKSSAPLTFKEHNLLRYAMTERNVLSLTSHPFIVKLRYAFQTSDKLFMILDYCPGGDLGELLQKQKRFPEDLVRLYLCELILALEDLHKRDIIFRDLKPDNVVMDSEGHVLLTDFGLSKEGILESYHGAKSFCGSVAYLAPEMLKRSGHGKAVDWYLLGVVMYELLVGIPPFYANSREELFHNIENAPLKIPSYISMEGRNLLKALLQRNPAKRLGSGRNDSEEVKAHVYFKSVNWDDVLNRKLKLPVPHRKIRINTKLEADVFEDGKSFAGEKSLEGWSFVNQEKE